MGWGFETSVAKYLERRALLFDDVKLGQWAQSMPRLGIAARPRGFRHFLDQLLIRPRQRIVTRALNGFFLACQERNNSFDRRSVFAIGVDIVLIEVIAVIGQNCLG